MRSDSILGFVSGTSVNLWFMYSVLNLFKDDFRHRFGADMMIVYGPYIHQNRNKLQAQFMETGKDWVFMVDNDMVFEPKDVWLLFAAATERGPGIYSAPYMIEDGSMVCGPWDKDVPQVYHPMVSLPEKTTQVGVVGGGFTLVHRDVFEATGPDAFAALHATAGEDISFSWRAREAGFIPWLVPKANPGHHKSVVLYPHQQVRNVIGDEINLVEAEAMA